MGRTVLCPGYKQVDAATVTHNTLSSHTGYEPIKFVGTAANSATSGTSASDWILRRAAEVYLIPAPDSGRGGRQKRTERRTERFFYYFRTATVPFCGADPIPVSGTRLSCTFS